MVPEIPTHKTGPCSFSRSWLSLIHSIWYLERQVISTSNFTSEPTLTCETGGGLLFISGNESSRQQTITLEVN